ncbi:CLUMA_CG011632, isoform A [Clunio marinus]|uniref:CLUMA_CG011632, isoform A n=1 Tax=Clunio marinus TaxID=568069 RepID=A0A1J1IGV3_9DIPT|nr:CLUMA_CG011632, isoform A [Clunio marinus]
MLIAPFVAFTLQESKDLKEILNIIIETHNEVYDSKCKLVLQISLSLGSTKTQLTWNEKLQA